MPEHTLYTIGYGAREMHEFIALLKRYEIGFLVDCRSQPHSRWRREFNRQPLAAAIEGAGLRYLFMGDSIGGRPADASCYPNSDVSGRPSYALVQARPWFIAGIDRLIEGVRQGHRLAIMCAEQKPEVCHRTHLVADALLKRDTEVLHIDEAGELQSQHAVLERLTGGQSLLFDGR